MGTIDKLREKHDDDLEVIKEKQRKEVVDLIKPLLADLKVRQPNITGILFSMGTWIFEGWVTGINVDDDGSKEEREACDFKYYIEDWEEEEIYTDFNIKQSDKLLWELCEYLQSDALYYSGTIE